MPGVVAGTTMMGGLSLLGSGMLTASAGVVVVLIALIVAWWSA